MKVILTLDELVQMGITFITCGFCNQIVRVVDLWDHVEMYHGWKQWYGKADDDERGPTRQANASDDT